MSRIVWTYWAGMHARELLVCGFRRRRPLEPGKGLVLERPQHGAQPVRPLGMVRPGIVLEEGGDG